MNLVQESFNISFKKRLETAATERSDSNALGAVWDQMLIQGEI